MKKLIAGNWKMNGTAASGRELAGAVVAGIGGNPALTEACDFVVCPPAPYLDIVRQVIAGSAVALGAQDCASAENGAFTGDVSASMLADIGCSYVILGHSERRQHHKEKDRLVAAKASRAHKAGLTTIVCVGETAEEREEGLHKGIVESQLADALPFGANMAKTVVAYEPVWAIGTGKTATPDDIADMHQFIRQKLKQNVADSAQIRILYGGSVKPESAAAIFSVPNVDGALIGGASLKAEEYLAIAAAAIQGRAASRATG
jgi:triosephosphate isomerase